MADLVRLPDAALAAIRRRAEGLPPIGQWSTYAGARVIAIGPDEWLAIAPDADADALLARLAGHDATDVSGSRIAYRVTSADALDLLLAGCALDLEALRPGDAVATVLARAQVVIWVEADGFRLLGRRSFAGYLEAWAAANAARLPRP